MTPASRAIALIDAPAVPRSAKWAAATRTGEAYFVTDGSPVEFREFVTELVGTAGMSIPDRWLPYGVARLAAAASEAVLGMLKRDGEPPLDRLSVWIAGQECTIDTSKAVRELGYRPIISRADGLRALRDAR